MSQEILVAEAIHQFVIEDYDGAESLFRKILKMDPTCVQALYFLGLIASNKGVLDEAARLLYQATLLAPDNRDFAYSLAVVLQEDGKIQEAVDIYQRLPDMAESWNNLGNIHMAKGCSEEALQCFDKALKINPKMLWAKVNKAILLRERDNNKAIEILNDALKDDAHFIPALYQLSICYRTQGNIEKALSSIQQVFLNKNVPDFAWVEYGKVLDLQGKKQDALDAFNKAIEVNRFCQDAYFEKAVLLTSVNATQAEETYRNLIRINPSHAAAYNNLGSLLYEQGRVNEALEMYRQVVIINPNDTSASFNLAVALEDLGEYAEAAGLYFNVLSHHDLEDSVHIRLSSILPKLFETDHELSMRYAEGWVKNFPDNSFAVHTLSALSGKADTLQNNNRYVQNLYDAFAETYENKMQELSCHIPTEITKKIKDKHFNNVLDLGCGSGLCGQTLKPFCDHITGVDISANMLEIAKKKDVYEELILSDIEDFLSRSKTKYDLIVAADVFCYIYQLNSIFENVYHLLEKGGVFIFTVEKSEKDAVQIIPQGRYQHAQAYIQNALSTIGFEHIDSAKIALRQEGSTSCQGLLFIVCK